MKVYYTLEGIPQSEEFYFPASAEQCMRNMCVRNKLREFYVLNEGKWKFHSFYWNSKKQMWCKSPHVTRKEIEVPHVYRTLQMVGA